MATVIYEKLKDLHVSAHVIYPGNDSVLYTDATLTTKLTLEDATDWFLQGSLYVYDQGHYYVPTDGFLKAGETNSIACGNRTYYIGTSSGGGK